MLSLFGNIAGFEVLVIAALAVIVFGKRLPEVAGQAYANFRKVRESLERLRRESGIDREMREIERSVREAEWRKTLARNAPPIEHTGKPLTAPPADDDAGSKEEDEEERATAGIDAHRGEADEDDAGSPAATSAGSSDAAGSEGARAPGPSFDDRREA